MDRFMLELIHILWRCPVERVHGHLPIPPFCTHDSQLLTERPPIETAVASCPAFLPIYSSPPCECLPQLLPYDRGRAP
jgi:hypothetical protein